MKTSNLKRTMVALGAIALLVGVSDLTMGKGGFWSPLTPGNIEGRWKLNEGTGTTTADISGNSNTGTLNGGVTWVDAKEGKGLSFDGTDDYVDCGTTGLPANNAAQSITWWHKVTSTPSTTQCVIDVHNNVSSSGIQTGFKNSKITVWKHGGDVLVEATSPSDGGWHHYAYTFDGTTHRLFIDGLERNSSTVAPQTATPDTLAFGRWDGGASQYFAGELDEVRVYSRTISVAEVKGLAGNPGLEALLRLDEGSGTTTADVSGNQNDGTLNGGPTWVAGKGGNALDFDGTDDYVSSSATGFPAADEAQTIAYWQNVSSTPSTVHCAVDIHNNISNHSVQGGFRSSKVTFWQHGGTVLVDATAPSTGAWHHIAYTFDGTTHRLYIDGTEQSTSTVTPQTAAPDTFALGRWDGGTSEYFAGKLDDVRVYSRELSADEVKGLAGGSGTGLAAVYYDNIDWTGSHITRTDSVVLFDWGTGSPDPAIGADTFSAVWTGQVEAQFDEIYRFYTLTDDGVRVWVDGQLVIDFPNDMPATLKQGIPITLEAGKKYDVRMEYYENLVLAVAALGWESPSQPLTFIPQSQLYPTDGVTPTFDTATAESSDLKTVYLRFSERMDKTTAETTGNYTVSGGITVNSATLSSDGRVVTLSVSSNVTLGTTTVQASSSILGITREAIATTTKTIVAGSPEGIPDSTAVTLSLSTDDNQCAILENEEQAITLTVTAPGTTATTVDLSQMKVFQNGLSWVKFDEIGDNLNFQVTTSGGTPNEATVKLRGQDFGAFKKDAMLVAKVNGVEQGFKDFTVLTLSFTPQCVYSADMRPVKQEVQTTPACEGIQVLTTSRLTLGGGLAGAEAGSILSAPQFSETDSSGKGTRQFIPRALDSYIINDERLLTNNQEDNENGSFGTDYSDDGSHGYRCDYPNCPPGPKTEGSYPCQNGSTPDSSGGSPEPGPVNPNSVDVSNGEKKLYLWDLVIKGRGFNYEFRRAYVSHDYREAIVDPGDFGQNWTYTYADDFLIQDGSDSTAPIIHIQAGQANSTYVFRGTINAWQPVRELHTQITKNLNPQPDVFELRDSDGTRRVYHDFSDTGSPNTNGRLKERRDRNDNLMSFLYDQIDPDGTASNGDEKFVLTRVVDTMGREIRYVYYAATAQSSGGRSLTIVETGTGARGRLARVMDFKGDMDFSDNDASEDFPNQVNNRTLVFDYDSEGNLVRCSGPAVGGTPTANDFPNGKTSRYQYIVEGDLLTLVPTWASLSNDQKNVVRGRLLHKLTHIWYPNEVQDTVGSNPPDADAAETLTYNVTATFDPPASTCLASGNFLGFVKTYTIGGQNGNGVPSGGTITYTYTDLNPDKNMPGSVSADYTLLLDVQNLKVEVEDRNGNEAEYIWGGGRTMLEYREKTSGFRTGEPADYLLTLEHQKDEFLKKQTFAEGNTNEFFFNEDSTDRFQQGNLIRSIRTPDARGADQDKIETVIVYEPVYNRPCLVVQARGSDIDNNDFTPPVTDPNASNRQITDPYDTTKKIDLRYSTVHFFDFQESSEKADDAPDTRLDIDGSGGKVNESPLITVDPNVLTTHVWLVQELDLPETAAGLTELKTRLSDNMTKLGLGDLNGDNDTTPQFAGNIIRTVYGSPVILDDTNQDKLESDIETAGDLVNESLDYIDGGTQEGTHGGALQTIVWVYQYNLRGQVVQAITPEGNVRTYEYFSENDPDGDAITTPTPADGRALDTATGGYLKETLRDRTRTDADVKFFDQAGTNKDTATFHNNDTAPTATDITSSYTYDDVGNIISRTNPRGIRDDHFVNELNQIVEVSRAADVSGAASANPSDPLVGASIGQLTAFAYLTRSIFDFNNRVVLLQTEDRGNTSAVDGNGLSQKDLNGTLISVPIPQQVEDTTRGAVTVSGGGDASGGTAFLDRLYLYDRINNLIETRAEVDVTRMLQTRFRFDSNQHLVFTIMPEGNASSREFDERDLIINETIGATARPSAGLFASGDPTSFNRPGGTGTVSSTFTYNYDDNRNLTEFVDAADTDGDSSNNSVIAGAGDVHSFTYDGYDRLSSETDSLGNVRALVYDPDSNVVRRIEDGDPVADVVGSGDNKTLLVREVVHDALKRPIITHLVLFQTPTAAPQRVPVLADNPSMDSLAAYLSDASSDAASVPGATGITVLGRVSFIREYDRENRPTFQISDDLDVLRTDWDGATRKIKRTDSALSNGFSSPSFDPSNIDGNSAEFAYDDNSQPIETKETDVTGVSNVADEVFRSSTLYDSLDRVQTRVDSIGQTLDYRYDSRSNLVSFTNPEGPVISRSINRRGLGSSAPVLANDFGSVRRYRYDGMSRPLETEIPLTLTGLGNGSYIGADLEGREIAPPVGYLDPNQSGDGLLSEYVSYDDNSLQLALRDDNGNTTGYIFDNQDRRVCEVKGLSFLGVSFGPIVCPTSSLSGDFGSFNVALRGGVVPIDSEPTGTDRGYVYDPDWNVTSVTDEAGNVISVFFDSGNRTTSKSISRTAGFIGTTQQTYKYDGLNRLSEWSDNNDPAVSTDDVVCKAFYDSLWRMVEEQQKIGTLAAKATSADFEVAVGGSVVGPSAMIYPDGRRIINSYDALDRLVSRKDSGFSVIGQYEYIGDERVAVLTYQNDTRLTFVGQQAGQNADLGYDSRRRPVNHRWESFTTQTLGQGVLLVGFEHQDGTATPVPLYDRANNKQVEYKSHDPSNSEQYKYDSAHRVTSTGSGAQPVDSRGFERGAFTNSSRTSMSGGVAFFQDWDLDGLGNWVREDDNTRVETRDHSDFNEVASRTVGAQATNLTHDKNGNTTDTGNSTLVGQAFPDGALRIEFDALNRARKVFSNNNTPGSTGDDVLLAEYLYDSFNRRMRTVVTNSGPLNGTTAFYYQGWRVVEEHDGADAILRQYVTGRYTDELWTIDDRQGGITVAQLNDSTGGQRHFYHWNTLLHVYGITNEATALVEAYEYDVYGRQTVITDGNDPDVVVNFNANDVRTIGGNSAVGNPYMYTGQRWDSETGLMYYKNRYYSQQLGRFLSRDPYDYAGGLNLYQYVSSRPTRYTDSLGLQGMSNGYILEGCGPVEAGLAFALYGIPPFIVGGKISLEATGTACWCRKPCHVLPTTIFPDYWDVTVTARVEAGIGAGVSITIWRTSIGVTLTGPRVFNEMELHQIKHCDQNWVPQSNKVRGGLNFGGKVVDIDLLIASASATFDFKGNWELGLEVADRTATVYFDLKAKIGYGYDVEVFGDWWDPEPEYVTIFDDKLRLLEKTWGF